MTSEKCIERIKERCSIRKLGGDVIPQSDIDDIIETGFSAPSAGNRQPWRVVVVKNAETRTRLSAAALDQKFVATAPVVLVVCAVPEESAERYGERGAGLYALQDTAALTQNLLLAAHLKGYGACWVGAFNEDAVTEVLGIPTNMRPVSIVPIGAIEGEVPARRQRRRTSEVVVKESFRSKE